MTAAAHTPDEPEHAAVVLAVTNQKGGVGKTTTAVSLAAALAEEGVQVLLVDLDPQGNATTGLGLRTKEGSPSTYRVLVDDIDTEDATQPTSIRGLHLLPSTLDLAGAEIELVSTFSREQRLKKAVDQVRDLYDLVLIDCPPSLGLLTINALVAADQVLVPIQCEYYALEGLGQLMRTVKLVQGNLNGDLELGGVVLTMFDGRTNLSQQVVDEVRDYFGDRAYNTIIPRTVRLSEAPSYGQPITVFDGSSRGARAYRRLAQETARRLGLVTESDRSAQVSPLDRLLGTTAPDPGPAPESMQPPPSGESLPTDLPQGSEIVAEPSVGEEATPESRPSGESVTDRARSGIDHSDPEDLRHQAQAPDEEMADEGAPIQQRPQAEPRDEPSAPADDGGDEADTRRGSAPTEPPTSRPALAARAPSSSSPWARRNERQRHPGREADDRRWQPRAPRRPWDDGPTNEDRAASPGDPAADDREPGDGASSEPPTADVSDAAHQKGEPANTASPGPRPPTKSERYLENRRPWESSPRVRERRIPWSDQGTVLRPVNPDEEEPR